MFGVRAKEQILRFYRARARVAVEIFMTVNFARIQRRELSVTLRVGGPNAYLSEKYNPSIVATAASRVSESSLPSEADHDALKAVAVCPVKDRSMAR
jgi:hypothetical protein